MTTKILIILVILLTALAVVVPSTASATHSGWSCEKWHNYDPIHTNAPGSMSIYGCNGMGGDYVEPWGYGYYSGTLHKTLLHAHHHNCFLGWCDTWIHAHNHRHT